MDPQTNKDVLGKTRMSRTREPLMAVNVPALGERLAGAFIHQQSGPFQSAAGGVRWLISAAVERMSVAEKTLESYMTFTVFGTFSAVKLIYMGGIAGANQMNMVNFYGHIFNKTIQWSICFFF